VKFTVASSPAIAFGSVRLAGDGVWETRTVIKVASANDSTPYLTGSPTVCDTGFRRNTPNFNPSVCSVANSGVLAVAWFVAPSATHQYPFLRAMSSNSAVTAAVQCAQGVVDMPYSDRINNQNAVNGLCSWGSGFTNSGNVSLVSIPGAPSPGPSGAYRADWPTMDKICTIYNYTAAASYTAGSYSSCGDNVHVRWNPSSQNWEVVPACSQNSHISTLKCYRIVF
jgi:hypothetical protein